MSSTPKFKFRLLVELLEQLDPKKHDETSSLTSARDATQEWFKLHNDKISRHGPSAVAFLSCLLPHRLPHRTYGLRERRLGTVVADSLYLPEEGSRRMRLKFWNSETDFPTLVEKVLQEAENLPQPSRTQVTLEEIDAALIEVAAKPGVSGHRTKQSRRNALYPILKRLTSAEAKWLMRMILKSYSPVVLIPERTVLEEFHFLLPNLLAIQNSLEAALNTLDHEDLRDFPIKPPVKDRHALYERAAIHVLPKLGVMIQRQPYYKARTINHCAQMAGRRTMNVERKYDGEYCQIHIDLSEMEGARIKIFSKSGKDSTTDREGLHRAIEDSLLLDDVKCPIKKNCILEGELLVWNRKREQIQPFHIIRKYVLHGGRTIGTAKDSPKDKDDNLMIMYYDLLYIDDESLLNVPLWARRTRLEGVIEQRKGVCEIGTCVVQNFGVKDAQKTLCDHFLRSIKERWEGLVLKGIQDPYFSWSQRPTVIKLKPDYVSGLTQSIDLCIVGGFLERNAAIELKLEDISWTSFYLASFDNKAEVEELNARPRFRVVDVLRHHNLTKPDILHMNNEGRYRKIGRSESDEYFNISFECKVPNQPAKLFKEPFVVEAMGAGFDKPQDVAYFTLRFPRVKLHTDRTFLATSSFDELQAMAEEHSKPISDSFEDEFRGRLQKANGSRHQICDEQSQGSSSLGDPENSTLSSRPDLRNPTVDGEPHEPCRASSCPPSTRLKPAGRHSMRLNARTTRRPRCVRDEEEDSQESSPVYSAATSDVPTTRHPRYIPDEAEDSQESSPVNGTGTSSLSKPAPTDHYNMVSNAQNEECLQDLSGGESAELWPRSSSATSDRTRPASRHHVLSASHVWNPISPPVVKRHSSAHLRVLFPLETSASIGDGNLPVSESTKPSIPRKRFHSPQSVLNKCEPDKVDAVGSPVLLPEVVHRTMGTILPTQSYSHDTGKGKGKAVEFYDGPPSFSLSTSCNVQERVSPPPFFEPPVTLDPPALPRPPAPRFLTPSFRPIWHDAPEPLTRSHPHVASASSTQGAPQDHFGAYAHSCFPPHYPHIPVQTQTSANRHPPRHSDLRIEARGPLTEIPNLPDQRAPKRPSSDSGHEKSSNVPVNADRPKKKYCTGRLRGSASSPSTLAQSIERVRLQCTILDDVYPRERKILILAHICRSPSSTAATSIGRVLTSHWDVGTRGGVLGGQSACECADCRLILVVLVDDSRPRDVAREIKHTSSALVNIREQALINMSLDSESIRTATSSGNRDQKLMIFLSKSAKPVLSKLELEGQVIGAPSRCDRYVMGLNTAFRTYFAGAIHVSFPRPFFSPTMARSLSKESLMGADSSTARGAYHFGGLSHAGVERKTPSLVAAATALDSSTVIGSSQSKVRGSAEVVWKWSRVLNLMGSLECDAVQL